MKKRGEPVLEFQSSEWMQDLAFMVDITRGSVLKKQVGERIGGSRGG